MDMRRSKLSVLLVLTALALWSCGSSTARYTVGGTVSGLNISSGSLVLQINGGETTEVIADGSFAFPTQLAAGSSYAITVASAPVGYHATITGGSGVVSGAVTAVVVTVAVETYTIGGVVTGLDGSLVLRNNGEDVTLDADGSFTFPTPVANGTPYSIDIVSAPAGQHCTVANLQSGTVNGGNVTGIAVVCLNHFTVGGTISGLHGNVILSNNGGDEITLTQDGPFTFPTPVVDGRSYEITVVGGSTTQRFEVTNGNGIVDGTAVNHVTIGCTSKSWRNPVLLAYNQSPDGQDATWPRAAMAVNGDTVLVWQQSDGSNEQVFVAECRHGNWLVPQDVSSNVSPDGTDAIRPRVAMGDDGDTIVVWLQSDGTHQRVMRSEYRDGAWTHPASMGDAIDLGGSDASDARVAMGSADEAIVIWEQGNGSHRATFATACRYGTWTAPSSLTDTVSVPGSEVQTAEVAVAANGDAIVAVVQDDQGATPRIFLSERLNGLWTRPHDLDGFVSPSFSAASAPSLAMAPNGDAVMTWTQSDGLHQRVFTSQRVGGSWTHPTAIGDAVDPGGSDAINPRAAIAANGDAIVCWTQSDGANLQVFRSVRHDGTWTHPSGVTDNISPDGWEAAGPSAGMAQNGDVVMAWHQLNAASLNVARAECRDGSWQVPVDQDDIIAMSGTNVIILDVAVTSWGDAVIVWEQSDSANEQIFISEYR